MADVVQKVRIEGDSTGYEKAVESSKRSMRGLASSAKSANKQMSDGAKKSSTSFASLATKIGAAALAIGAASKAAKFLTGQLKAGVKDAIEYETTTRRLAIALDNAGLETGRYIDFLQLQASNLQNVTGKSEELIRTQQQQALSLGVGVDRVEDYIVAAHGLANAMGVSVDTAMRQLIKTQTGLVDETLSTIGAVKSLTKEQLKSGEAVDVVLEKFKGMAGPVGPARIMTAFNNAAADARKEFGRWIISSDGWGKEISKITGAIVGLTKGMKALGAEYLYLLVFDPEAAVKRQQMIDAYNEALALAKKKEGDLGGGTGGGGTGGGGTGGGGTGGGGGARRPGMFDDLPDKPPSEWKLQTYEQIQREYNLKMIDLRNKLADQLASIEENRLEKEKDINLRRLDLRNKLADQMAAIDERELAEKGAAEQEKFAVVQRYSSMAASAAIGAMNAWVRGQKVALGQIIKDVLSSIGTQMMAEGIKNVFTGTARTLFGDPTGSALVSTGAAQIAQGVAFAGTAKLMGGGGQAGGGRGSASQRSGPGLSTGMTGGSSMTGGGEPKQITVVFNGPTTKAEVGVAIKDAIATAEARGF